MNDLPNTVKVCGITATLNADDDVYTGTSEDGRWEVEVERATGSWSASLLDRERLDTLVTGEWSPTPLGAVENLYERIREIHALLPGVA